MMCLINKCLIILVAGLLITISGCLPDSISSEEYFELCPYELKYGRKFHLDAPINISPHQMTYEVGDTISFSYEFTDTIFCHSREHDFVIGDFPFNTLFSLYRFDSEGWHSGLLENDIIIDSVYAPLIVDGTSRWSVGVNSFATYIDNIYSLNFQLILVTPGRYVTSFFDRSWAVDELDILDGLFPEYLSVTNNSGCPDARYGVCHGINGDPHYEAFSTEMTFLDEGSYRGRLYSLGTDRDDPIWGGLNEFGSHENQGRAAEWVGIFGFEVVE